MISLTNLQNVHDDPGGPDITGLVILLRTQDLRSNVVRSVARSLQSVLDHGLLGKPKICQL